MGSESKLFAPAPVESKLRNRMGGIAMIVNDYCFMVEALCASISREFQTLRELEDVFHEDFWRHQAE